MEGYSVEHLRSIMPTLDLYLDTLWVQIELEQIQGVKWVLSGTEQDPTFLIYPDQRKIWVLYPNSKIRPGAKSWLSEASKATISGSLTENKQLLSVGIFVLEEGVPVANMSLEAFSVRSILLKARIRLEG